MHSHQSTHTQTQHTHTRIASGVGGPHIGPPYVWPMALIVQALTSDDDQEIEGLLKVRKYVCACLYNWTGAAFLAVHPL